MGIFSELQRNTFIIHTHICNYMYSYLHYITLQQITSHHITLHHITSQYITLHYITSHHITLHYITYIHTYISKIAPWTKLFAGNPRGVCSQHEENPALFLENDLETVALFNCSYPMVTWKLRQMARFPYLTIRLVVWIFPCIYIYTGNSNPN